MVSERAGQIDCVLSIVGFAWDETRWVLDEIRRSQNNILRRRVLNLSERGSCSAHGSVVVKCSENRQRPCKS